MSDRATDPFDLLDEVLIDWTRNIREWNITPCDAEAALDSVRERDRLAQAVVEAAEKYHDLMPGLASCANELGEALLYSEAYQANQRAEVALAAFRAPSDPPVSQDPPPSQRVGG